MAKKVIEELSFPAAVDALVIELDRLLREYGKAINANADEAQARSWMGV